MTNDNILFKYNLGNAILGSICIKVSMGKKTEIKYLK